MPALLLRPARGLGLLWLGLLSQNLVLPTRGQGLPALEPQTDSPAGPARSAAGLARPRRLGLEIGRDRKGGWPILWTRVAGLDVRDWFGREGLVWGRGTGLSVTDWVARGDGVKSSCPAFVQPVQKPDCACEHLPSGTATPLHQPSPTQPLQSAQPSPRYPLPTTCEGTKARRPAPPRRRVRIRQLPELAPGHLPHPPCRSSTPSPFWPWWCCRLP